VSPENAAPEAANAAGMGGLAAEQAPGAEPPNGNNAMPSMPQPSQAPDGAPTNASQLIPES
jgi:hypothetical protein